MRCFEEFRAKAQSFFAERNIDPALIEYSGWCEERALIVLKTYGIKTKVIVEDFEPDTSIEIFGRKFSSPIMPAPLSGIVKAIDGECFKRVVEESQKAVVLPWIGYPCDRQDIQDLRDFVWIIKPLKNRKLLYDEIEYAEKRCVAVGVDLDCFAYEKLSGKIFSYEYLKPLSFQELADLVSTTKLPFVAKGILSETDYDLAVKAGCDAVVISNRGGRIIESAVSPLEILTRIEKIVETGVDSFIRSGEDALKALALGADFVLVGRAVVYGLTFNGGVKAVLECLKDELKLAMKVCGAESLETLGRDILVQL